LGTPEGDIDGESDGSSEEAIDGSAEAIRDGMWDSATVGGTVGHAVVGRNVGRPVGCAVGCAEGSYIGEGVDASGTTSTSNESIPSALEGAPSRFGMMGDLVKVSATIVAIPIAANVETPTIVADSQLLLFFVVGPYTPSARVLLVLWIFSPHSTSRWLFCKSSHLYTMFALLNLFVSKPVLLRIENAWTNDMPVCVVRGER